MPGDRQNPCRGILRPIRAEVNPKKGYVIVYKCSKCGEIKRNRAACDARVQPDDLDFVIRLTAAEP